jgi:hypothetical protein
MPAAPKTYTRLTRDTSGVGTYTSLWLAADHFLVVTASGVNESYARFDLRDVQGFFLTPTKRRLGWGLGWGGIAVTSLIVVLMSWGSRNGPLVSPIFLVVALTALIWNHLLGEGCAVYIVTGVQTAKLPPLIRMGKARKALARLQPLIEAAQADLTVPPAVTVAPEPSAESGSTPAPTADAPPTTPPPAS